MRLLDRVDGVETWFARENGRITLHNRQNCAPILNYNKIGRSNGLYHPLFGRHVAKIPHVVVAQWVDEAGMTMREFNLWTLKERRRFLAKRLNDSDWKNLKSTDRSL